MNVILRVQSTINEHRNFPVGCVRCRPSKSLGQRPRKGCPFAGAENGLHTRSLQVAAKKGYFARRSPSVRVYPLDSAILPHAAHSASPKININAAYHFLHGSPPRDVSSDSASVPVANYLFRCRVQYCVSPVATRTQTEIFRYVLYVMARLTAGIYFEAEKWEFRAYRRLRLSDR